MSEALARKLGEESVATKAYASYEEMIADLKKTLTIVEGNLLKARWMVGWQAYLVMENRKYGDKSIEDFAEKLELGTSLVYSCKKFYETFSIEDLNDRLIKHGVPLRKAFMLMNCNDTEQRRIIEDSIFELNLSETDIKRLIDKVNKGEKLPNKVDAVMGVLAAVEPVDEPVPEDVEEVLSGKASKKEVEEVEAEEESEKAVSAATSDVNGEDKLVRELLGAAHDMEDIMTALENCWTKLNGQLDKLSSLTGDNYTKCNKELKAVLRKASQCSLCVYKLQKTFGSYNITLTK